MARAARMGRRGMPAFHASLARHATSYTWPHVSRWHLPGPAHASMTHDPNIACLHGGLGRGAMAPEGAQAAATPIARHPRPAARLPQGLHTLAPAWPRPTPQPHQACQAGLPIACSWPGHCHTGRMLRHARVHAIAHAPAAAHPHARWPHVGTCLAPHTSSSHARLGGDCDLPAPAETRV